jgi:Fe-S-cluster containining protein
MRPYFNVKIYEWEAFKYKTEIQDGIRVLIAKPNGDCLYLDGARCSIYNDRPHQCRAWHCSPEGNKDDPQITKRENGWLLVVGSNEVLSELNKKEP